MRGIRRREFITLLGGAMAALPLAARAQQPERVRRIGVLMNVAAADLEGQAQVAAFLQALQQLGWNEGLNVRTDTRWGENDVERDRRYATELLAIFAPEGFGSRNLLGTAGVGYGNSNIPWGYCPNLVGSASRRV
jgi:hypothetical protein